MSPFKPTVVAVIAVGACLLAACGGGSTDANPGSPTSPTGSPSTGSAVAQAVDALKPYLATDASFDLTPLKSAPPTGKTITFVSCPLSNCQNFEDGLKAASAKLGWSVKSVNAGLTPDTISSTWNTVVQNPGDAVVAVAALPDSAISGQLDALKSKNVPVVQILDPDGSAVAAPILAKLAPQGQNSQEGRIWADWIVADSRGSAKIAYFTDPSYPDLKAFKTVLDPEMSAICPTDCSTSTQTFAAADIGKTVPAQVVSFVQSNPDVGYLAFGVGDAVAGVPEALAAAGLSGKVKLVTGRTGVANLQAISNGGQAMGIVGQSYEVGWQAADLLLRHLEGMPITDTQPVGLLHVITKDDLPSDISVPYTVPGYQAQFLKAWSLGS